MEEEAGGVISDGGGRGSESIGTGRVMTWKGRGEDESDNDGGDNGDHNDGESEGDSDDIGDDGDDASDDYIKDHHDNNNSYDPSRFKKKKKIQKIPTNAGQGKNSHITRKQE